MASLGSAFTLPRNLPINTEQNSFSLPIFLNRQLYRNLNAYVRRDLNPISSKSLRCAASRISSPFLGWLQQVLDQYPPQSIFSLLLCCINTSPFELNMKMEKARWRIPLPRWHCIFSLYPTGSSFSFTKIRMSVIKNSIQYRV